MTEIVSTFACSGHKPPRIWVPDEKATNGKWYRIKDTYNHVEGKWTVLLENPLHSEPAGKKFCECQKPLDKKRKPVHVCNLVQYRDCVLAQIDSTLHQPVTRIRLIAVALCGESTWWLGKSRESVPHPSAELISGHYLYPLRQHGSGGGRLYSEKKHDMKERFQTQAMIHTDVPYEALGGFYEVARETEKELDIRFRELLKRERFEAENMHSDSSKNRCTSKLKNEDRLVRLKGKKRKNNVATDEVSEEKVGDAKSSVKNERDSQVSDKKESGRITKNDQIRYALQRINADTWTSCLIPNSKQEMKNMIESGMLGETNLMRLVKCSPSVFWSIRTEVWRCVLCAGQDETISCCRSCRQFYHLSPTIGCPGKLFHNLNTCEECFSIQLGAGLHWAHDPVMDSFLVAIMSKQMRDMHAENFRDPDRLSNEKFKDPTRSNIASAQCQQSRPDLVSEAFETSSKVFRTDVSMKNSVNDVAIKMRDSDGATTTILSEGTRTLENTTTSSKPTKFGTFRRILFRQRAQDSDTSLKIKIKTRENTGIEDNKKNLRLTVLLRK